MAESFNPFSLCNKTILITGASSGIGRSCAIECSKMGATVVITGRDENRLQNTLLQMEGEGHVAISADLTSPTDIIRLINDCPTIQGVVHSAGVSGRSLLKTIKQKDIEKMMKTNFEAPVLLQRELLKLKKVQKGASIVFISSRAPFAPSIGNGLYSASKGALIAYAKVLGLELASNNIRVNCICPAIVNTELLEKEMYESGLDFRNLEKQYPLGRIGKPEDIAYLAIYLLSDASQWITGSCIDATGGGEFTLKG